MSENSTPDPKHISELLGASVHAELDEERAHNARRVDLQSEVSAVTGGIADIEEQMAQTGDHGLQEPLDHATDDAMRAQRELEDLEGNKR